MLGVVGCWLNLKGEKGLWGGVVEESFVVVCLRNPSSNSSSSVSSLTKKEGVLFLLPTLLFVGVAQGLKSLLLNSTFSSSKYSDSTSSLRRNDILFVVSASTSSFLSFVC